jgi:hypothetical protein
VILNFLIFFSLLVALSPLIFHIVSRDKVSKTVHFLIIILVSVIIFILYFAKGSKFSSFETFSDLARINSAIEQDISLSSIDLAAVTKDLGINEKAIFLNNLFEDSLERESLESAASLLAFTNAALYNGDFQSILLVMYANLRDKQYPELLNRQIKIQIDKETCSISKLFGAAFLANGPKIPISENVSFINELILKQDQFIVRGFDMVSAILNNEIIGISLEKSCDNEIFISSLEVSGASLLSEDLTLYIEKNAWLKKEQ